MTNKNFESESSKRQVQIKIVFKCQLTADIFNDKVFREINNTGKSNTTALLSPKVYHYKLISTLLNKFVG